MKICIISTMAHVPWAACEELWAATARAALEAGHEVAIVAKRWPDTPPAIVDLQSRGARVFLRAEWRSRRAGSTSGSPAP